MPFRFEWDLAKADANYAKHGVSFDEAATAFGDPLSLTIADPVHSLGEERFILLGQTYNGRLLVVAHVERADDCIRMISARRATRIEARAYEKD